MSRVTAIVILIVTIAAGSPASAEIGVLSSFDPSASGGLCGLGVDPTTGNVWVYECFGGTIDVYSPAGVHLGSLPRPGETANDVDLEFAPEALTLNGTVVPAGTLLFINGETGVAEIYAVDTQTGVVLASLVTAFGASHVVGGGYDPVRDVFFLLQDRVPAAAIANRVGEIDPVTGAVLNSFPIGTSIDVNYGDLDVSTGTGHLLVASSLVTSLKELTPTGDFVATHDLPAGVTGISGLGLECGLQEGWVANPAGQVWRLGALPCGAASAVEPAAGERFALQPSYPDPFANRTSLRFTLPHPSPTRLTVHDLRGRLVRELVDGSLPSGPHVAVWDGNDDTGRPLPSGAYFYRLTAGGQILTQSTVLLR